MIKNVYGLFLPLQVRILASSAQPPCKTRTLQPLSLTQPYLLTSISNTRILATINVIAMSPKVSVLLFLKSLHFRTFLLSDGFFFTPFLHLNFHPPQSSTSVPFRCSYCMCSTARHGTYQRPPPHNLFYLDFTLCVIKGNCNVFALLFPFVDDILYFLNLFFRSLLHFYHIITVSSFPRATDLIGQIHLSYKSKAVD